MSVVISTAVSVNIFLKFLPLKKAGLRGATHFQKKQQRELQYSDFEP
tara:strand:+ start:1335 stop:1475 length:141 start_codon:yes stop_codon:yes gene_type:complete